MTTFIASRGSDVFAGATDATDTVDYSQGTASAGVKIDLSVPGQTTVGSGTDTLTSIENVIGTQFNDYLRGSTSDNELWGMGGDDKLRASGGHDVLHGGDGTDTLLVILDVTTVDSTTVADSATVFGDAGDDVITVVGLATTSATVDGGSGDDTIRVADFAGSLTLTLGDGQDRVVVTDEQTVLNRVVITDFQAGDNGDRIDLNVFLAGINPFDTDTLRLVDSTDGTLVQLNTVDGWQDIAVLQGVTSDQLTAWNFSGASPTGISAAGEVIHAFGDAYGTAGDDVIYGATAYGQGASIYAGAGNDVIYSLPSWDFSPVVDAGAGDDIIHVSSGLITTGSGNDVLIANGGGFAVTDFDPDHDRIELYNVDPAHMTIAADDTGTLITIRPIP